MPHSTKPKKAAKPYPDFPLYPHRNGQWAKIIRRKEYYFGSWKTGTWQAAYERFKQEAPALYDGQEREVHSVGMTVGELRDRFLHFSLLKVKSGELKQQTWNEYHSYGRRIVRVLGAEFPLEAVGPKAGERLFEDLAKTHRSPDTLEGDKAKIAVFFNFANSQDFTERPIKLGPIFRRASRRVKRKRRAERRGHKFFEADEIRQMIASAPLNLRTMILLAVNCGFGNEDCATLPWSVVNLETGWIDYARLKTGKERRCPLWPETVAALRQVWAERKPSKGSATDDLVFVTRLGTIYGAKTVGAVATSISGLTRKLLVALGLHRKFRGFYSLRHVTYTIGRQRSALGAQIIMGHVDADRVSEFSNQISDAWYDEKGNSGMDHLLLAVSQHIHDWLFSRNGEPAGVVADGLAAACASAMIESPAAG